MQTTIYLVRHGHVHNPEAIHYGRLPRFGLSDEGRRQVDGAAKYLCDKPLAAIFSSPLLRARQTAKIIIERHPNLSLRISNLLHEVHSPFDGHSISEMEVRKWDLYSGTKPPYEQPSDVLKRSQQFMMRVRRQYPGRHILAVTHAGALVFTMLWARGFPLTAEYQQKYFPAPASIMRFVYQTEEPEEVPSWDCRET